MVCRAFALGYPWRISAHTQSPICIFHGVLVSWILSDEGDDVQDKICDPDEGSMHAVASLSPFCWLFLTDVRMPIYLRTCLCPCLPSIRSFFHFCLRHLFYLFTLVCFVIYTLSRLNLSLSFNHSLTLLLPSILSCHIYVQYMGARNRVGIGLSYRPARLHTAQPGGIGSLESILGFLKSIKIRALSRHPFYLHTRIRFFKLLRILWIKQSAVLQSLSSL